MAIISKSMLALAVAGAIGAASNASAGVSQCDSLGAANLVQNCGFEADGIVGVQPQGWTVHNTGANSSDTRTAGNPHSGTYGLAIGPFFTDDNLSQTLTTTVPGDTYTFTFYLYGDPGATNHFAASWDGGQLFNVVNDTTAAYTMETFTVLAAGNDKIDFYGFDNTSYMYLDDISVTRSVPEPASMFVLLAGLIGTGLSRRRR